MAFHGNTWYEEKFGAKLLENQDQHDAAKKEFNASLINKPPFDELMALVPNGKRKADLLLAEL
jgi:hypothetical protein